MHASEDQLRRVRGAEIAMIFQDPMTSLNPVHKIGRPDHRADPGARGAARPAGARAGDRAARAGSGIPRARERIDNYPFEFSGGMRQRVMIALALSCNPSVLIADEPTTALDVTIQAQILQRMRELRDETGAAIILVTHDLGVVADIADRIAVMYSGRIVEEGTLDEIFYDPQHPYTWGLLGLDRARRPAAAGAAAGDRRACRRRSRTGPQGCHFRPRCPHEFAQVLGGAAARGARGRPARPPRPLLAHAGREARAARGAAGRDRARRRSRRRERRERDRGRPRSREADANGCLVDVEHLKVFFPIKEGFIVDREVARVHAVNDVTFQIDEGETVGLVGESGCGKTTMSRAIMRLIDATDGTLRFRGEDITQRRPQADGAAAAPDADGLPGPVRVAQPAQARGADHRPAAAAPRDAARQGRGARCASCSTRSGSRPST